MVNKLSMPEAERCSSQPDESAVGFIGAAPDPLRYAAVPDGTSQLAELIVRMVPERARVLDVGCGSGDLAALLRARRQARVVGIEPDAARAQQTGEKGIEVLQEPFTASLSSRLGLYEVVLLADVLEHQADPLIFLRHARSCLSPGGCLIISVPNIAHWTVRLALLRGRFDYQPVGIMDVTHLRWFTAKTLLQLMRVADFELVEQSVAAGLDWYQWWRPWCWLPQPARDRLVLALARRWPELFGYQYLIKVVPRGA
jgi:methionine biosynthesis protein MetW